MKDEDKFSKIFATLLLLEEHQRVMKSRIDELGTYRMAQRATNLVQLLASERRDVDQDLVYIREILNSAPAQPEAKQEPVAWINSGDLSFDRKQFGHLDVAALYSQSQLAAARLQGESVNQGLRALLKRYRTETPLGHQPHMIAEQADAAIAAAEQLT